MNNTYVYGHKNSLYINLTNQCTNNCDFCIRHDADGIEGYDLWLKKEPEAKDIIAKLKNFDMKSYDEIVFCGYGEPMMKLKVLLDTAEYIKTKYPELPIRINTNGQANLYHRRDVTPTLKGLIDVVSISLNAPNAEEYEKICHSDFSVKAYGGILEFAKLAAKHVPIVKFSVVDVIGEEKIKQCQEISDKIGIPLQIRQMI